MSKAGAGRGVSEASRDRVVGEMACSRCDALEITKQGVSATIPDSKSQWATPE
jgi:hypothetical protein